MPKTEKTRERILKIAAEKFYKDGYRATGVDAIAKAAGITKATLYHHFQNKDDLIEQTLKHLSSFYQQEYLKVWNREGLSPRDKLVVMFDEIEAFFNEADCYGCPFINASSEYTDRDSPVRKISAAHYQFVADTLTVFAKEANLREPAYVAEQITINIIGAYTAWFVAGIKTAAQQAKKMSEDVIEDHTQ